MALLWVQTIKSHSPWANTSCCPIRTNNLLINRVYNYFMRYMYSGVQEYSSYSRNTKGSVIKYNSFLQYEHLVTMPAGRQIEHAVSQLPEQMDGIEICPKLKM